MLGWLCIQEVLTFFHPYILTRKMDLDKERIIFLPACIHLQLERKCRSAWLYTAFTQVFLPLLESKWNSGGAFDPRVTHRGHWRSSSISYKIWWVHFDQETNNSLSRTDISAEENAPSHTVCPWSCHPSNTLLYQVSVGNTLSLETLHTERIRYISESQLHSIEKVKNVCLRQKSLP